MSSRGLIEKVIYIAGEGKRERALFRFFFEDIFLSDLEKCSTGVTLEGDNLGGTNAKVIRLAIRHNEYDKRIAFTDNDIQVELDDQKSLYESLGKCWGCDIPIETPIEDLPKYHKHKDNPVVIISTPLNFECIVLAFLNRKDLYENIDFIAKNKETNKEELKKTVASFLHSNGSEDKELAYYKKHFDRKYCIRQINSIPQLKLLFKSVFGTNYCSKTLGIK